MTGDSADDILVKQRQKAREIIARVQVGSDAFENTLRKMVETLKKQQKAEEATNATTRN